MILQPIELRTHIYAFLKEISRAVKLTMNGMEDIFLILVRAECVRCPWAAGINVVATLHGIIFLLSFFLSPLLFYQKRGRYGFAILHGLLSN